MRRGTGRVNRASLLQSMGDEDPKRGLRRVGNEIGGQYTSDTKGKVDHLNSVQSLRAALRVA